MTVAAAQQTLQQIYARATPHTKPQIKFSLQVSFASRFT
jgi:hypothetical protein